MSVAVKMPQLGESVVEGTVARWHKQPGDAVEKLEPLLDISTDKIDTEVPAPAAGTLLKILVGEGETVNAGTVLAYIGEMTADGGPQTADDGRRTADVESETADEERATNGGQPSAVGGQSSEPAPAEKPRGRAFISPVVARMAAEHDLDLDEIEGTGLHGRITKKDVLRFLDGRRQTADGRPQTADEERSGHESAVSGRQSAVKSLRTKLCTRSRPCGGRLRNT